jgi:hypothetical protein
MIYNELSLPFAWRLPNLFPSKAATTPLTTLCETCWKLERLPKSGPRYFSRRIRSLVSISWVLISSGLAASVYSSISWRRSCWNNSNWSAGSIAAISARSSSNSLFKPYTRNTIISYKFERLELFTMISANGPVAWRTIGALCIKTLLTSIRTNPTIKFMFEDVSY